MQKLFSFDNDSIYPRQDEIWASQIWQLIVDTVKGYEERQLIPECPFSLEDAKRMQKNADLMFVIMAGSESGLYWNGEYVCGGDDEILDLAAALLYLRSQGHLVYKTTEEYQEQKCQQQEEYDLDSLGDLDDRPF